MYVKVLYDEKAKRGLLSGHGFSCLVDGKVLFDAGGGANSLTENMRRMMVFPSDLQKVVISHDHWDHTGGLWELLKEKKGLEVYACPSFSETFKDCVSESGGKLVLAEKFTRITENIYVTGTIEGEHKGEVVSEQALVVKGDMGVSVITGCAHPGIINMLEVIKKKMKVKQLYMVFGGFHLGEMERDDIGEVIKGFDDLGVMKAGPTHCSGDKPRRMFKGKYHENFIAVQAGHIIHL